MDKENKSVDAAPEKTSDTYKTDYNLPGRFEHPDWQKGYK